MALKSSKEDSRRIKACDYLEIDDDFYFEYDYSALASETIRFFQKQGYN